VVIVLINDQCASLFHSVGLRRAAVATELGRFAIDAQRALTKPTHPETPRIVGLC
jgi:hypothetical protein